jgi:phosphate transport system substrate-binding protein
MKGPGKEAAMTRLTTASALTISLLLLFPAAGTGEAIEVGGSGTPLAVMRLLGEAFNVREPGVRIEILPSLGSSGGIKAVREGAVALGVLTRRPNEKEADPALVVTEIARTPFVPVANRDVTASGVSLEQAARAYGGEISEWPDGGRLRVVLRPQYDSDTMLLEAMSPAMARALYKSFTLMGMQTGTTDQENADLLEKIPGSFGFSSLGQLLTEKRALKVLALDGVVPSVQALREGSYRFHKPVFLLTRGEPRGALARLVAFIRSPEGSRILADHGYLPMAASTP